MLSALRKSGMNLLALSSAFGPFEVKHAPQTTVLAQLFPLLAHLETCNIISQNKMIYSEWVFNWYRSYNFTEKYLLKLLKTIWNIFIYVSKTLHRLSFQGWNSQGLGCHIQHTCLALRTRSSIGKKLNTLSQTSFGRRLQSTFPTGSFMSLSPILNKNSEYSGLDVWDALL